MNRSSVHFVSLVLVVGLAALGAVACGPDTPANSAATLYKQAGCAGCHGSNGEGRVGPKLTDLYGSTVEVTDADGNTTEVTADGDYLRRSITDPDAQKVVGYTQRMPKANLTGAQVETLVAYIESLSSVPPDVTEPPATDPG